MQRFIVGTGRCGSTLFSTLMSFHPNALVLSEFFGGLDVVNAFREGPVNGQELSDILTRDHVIGNLNRSASRLDHEVLLDVGRYKSNRIPPIMLVCVPALTKDVDSLMREIVLWARKQPTLPLSAHYPNLFDWLCKMFKKDFWIERSGASSEFFHFLRRTFPGARYMHIHRDGAESAMSMRNHDHFKTHVSFYFDPPSDDEIEQAVEGREQPGEGLIARRRKALPSPEQFGLYWTRCIAQMLSQIKYLGTDQYREVTFEDLRGDPKGFLKRACAYFEISSDDAWIDRAVASIRPEKNARASELSDDERARLRAAVYPGQVMLERDGTDRINRDLHGRMQAIQDKHAPPMDFLN